MKSYNETLADINRMLNTLEKSAEDAPSAGKNIQPKDVLGGNRTKTDGQGNPVSEDGEDEVTTLQAEPSRTDPGKKSIEHLLRGEKKTGPSVAELADDYEKSSHLENQLLRNINAFLTKGAMPEEDHEDDYDKEDDEEYSEEEKKEMKDYSEEEKKAYIMSKRAGMQFAKQLHQTGVLQKIAMNTIAPHFNKIVAHEMGKQFAVMEKAGAFRQPNVKEAAHNLAGQYIAELENQGLVTVHRNGVQKQASQRPGYSQAQAREILKEAAAQEAESVICDLAKAKMGHGVNSLLGRLSSVNPQ